MKFTGSSFVIDEVAGFGRWSSSKMADRRRHSLRNGVRGCFAVLRIEILAANIWIFADWCVAALADNG
jgi:hypothetical protein